MTTFTYAVSVTVAQEGKGPEGRRMRSFVGQVKARAEEDTVSFGREAVVRALEEAVKKTKERS